MADRFPLIANPTTQQIEELAPGDNLNLTNSGIVGATTITASKFVGPLEGNATSADTLNNAANISSGIVSTSRLSGSYNISVTTANNLTNAANINAGTISSARLSGYYPISVNSASSSDSLTDASNIIDGIVPSERLSGFYDISVGTANTANIITPGTFQSIDIGGNAATATTAVNLSGGTVSGVNLNITGIGTINSLGVSGLTTTTSLTVINLASIGFASVGVATIGFGTFANIRVSSAATVGFLTATNVRVSGTATVGFLTATNLNSPNATLGILTASSVIGVNTLSAYDSTLDFINNTRITSNLLVGTGASIGIATIGFGTFANAQVSGILTAGTFSGNFIGGIVATAASIGIATINNANIGFASVGVATVGFASVGVATVGFLTATNVSVAETVTATTVDALAYLGSGEVLTGIVTQITAGIGVRLSSTQAQGKGVVNIDSYFPIGKTIFVTQNGSDTNSGLTESDSKRTIKAAAAIAFPGDTIKVFPGVYVEENPIYLTRRVAVEGTELRNCVVTPKYTDRDLFYVNNSCHITDLSFIGNTMTDGAAIVALQPLAGVSTDRFFDAARMIRYNLDFIAAETVGYLTSTDYKNPAFVVVDGSGSPIAPINCSDDIKDVMKAVIHDITRGGNLKCVGAGRSYFDDAGSLLHITGTDTNGYSVKEATIDALNYAAGIARSCINNVSWNGNYQTQYSQVKDLAMQADVATGSNEDIGSCANVVSAIYSCVGVVTTILDQGLSVLGAGINTTFPGNSGIGFTTVVGVTSAVYDNTSGETTILAPTLSVKPGDIVEVRDLLFDCTSGGSIGTQRYPSGAYGYQFDVESVNNDGSFVINTGVSTIAHNYVGGGFVVNRAIGVTTASYDNTTGITTITAPGAVVKVGQFVRLHDLEFSCTSGAGTTTLYPTGNLGYDFRVTEVIGTGTTFVVNTGVSTIPHTYEGGGVVFPPYSPGVGPITQGPYVRNCTNFVPGSIGMKVDGFEAEPGDQDDIGVTGTMSVDSYTQYNQGGIGVSITNGAYAQLVSIFTICDDIAIFTGSGGQCDITNSNSSFGRFGLVADGVGDYNSKSIYHYTGIANTEAAADQAVIEVSGIGNLRPYDGQTLHFGELYYEVQSITVDDGGFGYTQAPTVTIDSPTGPNGIRAEASANINTFGQVSSIDIISTGSQYRLGDNPQITIAGPTGAGVTATATLNLTPIYYTVESATLPSAGISTVTLNTNLNNTVSTGTTVYFNRLSLQITSSHSFEWVGSGNNINTAKPALGGVAIQENEVVKLNGGEVVYTSTDQAGNFKIGDDVTINQLTGTISGRAFNQSLLNTVTPLIIALGN
jgi:hypothetical protein